MADSDILRGAIQAAAGNTLGLTQDQVLDLKKQQLRERQRENRAGRAERAGNQGRAEDILSANDRSFQSIGSFEEQERYADPFGIPVSPEDPQRYTAEELREIDAQTFQNERGNYVTVDRGRGKERLWRENGQYSSEPKYAKNKRVDMADPFVKPSAAPQGAGMGGPNGLATQLADMVMRGEVNENDLVPGSSNKTIGRLIREMSVAADPQLQKEADIEEGRQTVRQDNGGMASEEIQRRATQQLRAETGDQSLNMYRSSPDPTKKPPAWSRASVTNTLPQIDQVAREQAIIDSITRKNAVNPLAQVLTDERNAREASGLESAYGQRRATGLQNLDQIETIESLGLASKKMNKSGVDPSLFSVTPYVDPASLPEATQMVGPDGVTVGYADSDDRFIADVNVDASSVSNAPVSRTATWMEGNLPDFGREGGTSFGARSINPGDELAMLNERLGQFGSPRGIRGIDDLEQAVRAVTVDAAFAGRAMWNYDQETGKKVAAKNPGIDEVLYGLDYTQDEKARLAAALQSVESAKLSPVNSLQKALFEEGIPSESNSRVTNDYDSSPQMARITSERVGRDNKKTGEKRTSVRKGLRELDGSTEVFEDRDPSTIYATAEDGSRVMLPEAQQDLIDARQALGDAQRPFQGVRQGEQAERPQFLGKKAVSMSPEQRVKAYGSEMGGIANNVESRKVAAETAKREAAQKPDPIAVEARRRDQDFAVAGLVRNAADNDREVNEARKRMGASLEGRGQMLLGGQIVPDSRPASADVPDRNVVPQGPLQAGATLDARKLIDFTNRQATSAVVNPSTDPIPLAARGGWMGGPGQGRVVSPFDPETTSAVTAQKATSTQEPLSGITYNESAPDPWSSQPATGAGISNEVKKRSAPVNGSTQGPRTPGIRQKIMNSIKRAPSNFAAAPRRQRYAAAAGTLLTGGLGVGSVFGGSDRNEQEAQY